MSEQADGPEAPGSVTEFRERLAALLAAEVAGNAPRHVVVLALDGVNVDVARDCWPSARTRTLHTVWPTTTAAGWLSHLTGLTVAEHGVPGVVFRPAPGEALVNVFDHPDPALTGPVGTVFHDARRLGYEPAAVLGDLETYRCGWRDTVLDGVHRVLGHRFYLPDAGRYRPRPPELIGSLVLAALRDGLRRHGSSGPCLLWCYLEIDRHVHEHGYDGHTRQVLAGLDRMAARLADEGVLVVAHADHGLVPTRPDPELAATLAALAQRYGFEMGGAGRTRWLYPAPGTTDDLVGTLRERLPESVTVEHADRLFGTPATSRARPRVGDVVLTATGEAFLADPTYHYEHGSLLPAELETPLSVWGHPAMEAISR
ncbi:alkaline phosphatase family protein [Micromonospora cathayae]|uniref:Alkaline phosphatase family protein n=1 Tax=Micromonospora cathayae TaxID=3028804 RepID=A0ABY7ZSG7_9ACTN|nr:alkaline phosphatase family protein [Micromonospora sp. HUAS 3]WDZ85845.1 alkaline phosphatase family protein [Micromonospora sp. HUAS 3]